MASQVTQKLLRIIEKRPPIAHDVEVLPGPGFDAGLGEFPRRRHPGHAARSGECVAMITVNRPRRDRKAHRAVPGTIGTTAPPPARRESTGRCRSDGRRCSAETTVHAIARRTHAVGAAHAGLPAARDGFEQRRFPRAVLADGHRHGGIEVQADIAQLRDRGDVEIFREIRLSPDSCSSSFSGSAKPKYGQAPFSPVPCATSGRP